MKIYIKSIGDKIREIILINKIIENILIYRKITK